MISKRALRRYIDAVVERKMRLVLDGPIFSQIDQNLHEIVKRLNVLVRHSPSGYTKEMADEAHGRLQHIVNLFSTSNPFKNIKYAVGDLYTLSSAIKEAELNEKTKDNGVPPSLFNGIESRIQNVLSLCKALVRSRAAR